MNIKKVLSIALAGCLMIGCIGPVSAEDRAAVVDGVGISTAQLTAKPLTLSVTVPMTLPINVAANGSVTVATNAEISSTSAGPVKVEGVKVEAVSPWTLAKYAEYEDIENEKVGTKKFCMQIQGTDVLADGTCAATFDTIPANGEAALTYDAYVAPQGESVDAEDIARVVFTVGWDSV